MTAQPLVRNGGPSMVVYRLGGREYPMVVAPTCKVCQSPYRFDVENEIISGRTWALIERSIAVRDADADLSKRNIRDHFLNGHMPLEQEASRRIIERRAEQRGLDVEKGVESLVDGMTAAELVIQKGVEGLQSGELKVDIKDMLTAARLLETFGVTEDGPDQGAYVEAFMVYHEVAASVMTTAQFEAFGKALSRNPVLKALVAKHSEATEDEDEDESIPGQIVASEQEVSVESPTMLDNGGD